MLVDNLFAYEGTNAVSRWEGTQYDIADFVEQIEAAP